MRIEAAPLRLALFRWYDVNGRHTLPWRLTRDPYAVLVSEVMLQQTQVDRVLPRYLAWLERWPSASRLADANVADVIREWSGLGYNRRAVRLHSAARQISAQGFPGTPEGLRALPGVGPYTAAAVTSFAFEQPVAVLDTNIARCLAHLVLGRPSQRELPARLVAAASLELLPSRDSRDWNLALMDFGALVCRAKASDCGACPLSEVCEWRCAGYPAEATPRRPQPRFEDTARFARGRIVEALRRSGPLSPAEIANLLPPDHAVSVAAYLAALERDGLVSPTATGGWSLPSRPGALTAG